MGYYAAHREDLTMVANAIRRKANSDARLIFPLDFVAAIDGLSEGGFPADVTEMACGEFLPSSDISSESDFKISHGMKTTPNFYAIWAYGSKNSVVFAPRYNVFQCVFGVKVTRTNGTKLEGLGTSFSYGETGDGFTTQVPLYLSSRLTSEHILPYLSTSSGDCRFKARFDYLWIAGRIERLY